MRIFLSYATEQKSAAEPIAFSLRGRGHHVFLDKDDLPPGRTFDEQIQKAVEQSDVMIFLISPTSVAKGRYTRTELEFARAAWRHPANRVLPVMIEPTPMADVPSFLKGVTILEPQGNVTAEVAAAVERLRGPELWTRSAGIAAAVSGVAAVVLGFVVANLNSELLPYAAGIPISMALWAIGCRQKFLFLIPIVTLGIVFTSAVSSLTSLHLIESIDTSVFEAGGEPDATSDQTASTDGSTEPHVKPAETDEEREYREQTLERIGRVNSFGRKFNLTLGLTALCCVLTLATLAGASFAAPELRNPRRWATSVIAAALAAAAFSTVAIAFLYDPSKFLAELPPALAVLSMWYVFAGGLLGFWVGRGQAT
jgi:hypothetical protein